MIGPVQYDRGGADHWVRQSCKASVGSGVGKAEGRAEAEGARWSLLCRITRRGCDGNEVPGSRRRLAKGALGALAGWQARRARSSRPQAACCAALEVGRMRSGRVVRMEKSGHRMSMPAPKSPRGCDGATVHRAKTALLAASLVSVEVRVGGPSGRWVVWMVWMVCTVCTVPSQPSGLNPPELCPGQAHVASRPNSAVRLLCCICRFESDRSFLQWQSGRSVGVWCPPTHSAQIKFGGGFPGPTRLPTKLDPAVELRSQTARRTQADRNQRAPLEGSPQDRADPRVPCLNFQPDVDTRHATAPRFAPPCTYQLASLLGVLLRPKVSRFGQGEKPCSCKGARIMQETNQHGILNPMYARGRSSLPHCLLQQHSCVPRSVRDPRLIPITGCLSFEPERSNARSRDESVTTFATRETPCITST